MKEIVTNDQLVDHLRLLIDLPEKITALTITADITGKQFPTVVCTFYGDKSEKISKELLCNK